MTTPWSVEVRPPRANVCGHACIRDNSGEVVALSQTLYGDDRDAEVLAMLAKTARAVNAHDDLLAACKRLTRNAECTCHDLGIGGGLCDVCEGKAAITKAEGRALPAAEKGRVKR